MSKKTNIAVAIVISSFLAMNLYLLFSDKSVIPKSVHIDRYDRMTANDYQQELAKESLIAPQEVYTVYVGDEETVDAWLVQEGDHVNIGDELAYLQTERVEEQRAVWETDVDALRQQYSALMDILSDLESERNKARSASSKNVKENTEGELNVDVQVDVGQDGSFAQAISATEKELAEIDRQLLVVEAQLSQHTTKPALISPVEGVVSNVTRHGNVLAVDIFSSQRVLVTYAKNDEWQQIESGDRVLIQGEGVEKALEGNVLSVSTTPAGDNEWLHAYKALDDKTVKNPLAYYEVRVFTDSGLESVPFGTNVNAVIVIDEALEAISVEEKWLHNRSGASAVVWTIDDAGRATKVNVETPFSWKSRAIVWDGLQVGDVVIHQPNLRLYVDSPQTFMSIPTDMPTKSEWRTFGWRNYLKYSSIQ